MSNICYEGTSYKSAKKRAEDRRLRIVLEMQVNDLLSISVHQKKIDILHYQLSRAHTD